MKDFDHWRRGRRWTVAAGRDGFILRGDRPVGFLSETWDSAGPFTDERTATRLALQLNIEELSGLRDHMAADLEAVEAELESLYTEFHELGRPSQPESEPEPGGESDNGPA